MNIDINSIITAASIALGLLSAIATLIVKFSKSAKARKIAENALVICEALIPYIKQAETFTNYTGAEKKEFVMTKIREYAAHNKLLFDSDKVSEQIEELVKMSKEVNASDKEDLSQIK